MKEDILFLELVYFFILGFLGSNEAAMGGGGRAAPRWAWQSAQKDGCAQRTGAHARQKPTSVKIIRESSLHLRAKGGVVPLSVYI